MAASRPKVARIALARAFEPSKARTAGSTTLDEIVDQGLHRRGVFRRAFDQSERMLVAAHVDAQCRHRYSPCERRRSDHQQLEVGKIGITSAAADSATKCREAAIRQAGAFARRNAAVGSRTERWNLRVETLISIAAICRASPRFAPLPNWREPTPCR